MKRTTVTAALLAASAAAILTGCGSSGSSSVTPLPAPAAQTSTPATTSTYAEDLHDPATLASAVEREVLDQRGITLDVTCLDTSDDDTLICHAYAPADGSEGTITVHVSPDGQRFITEGDAPSA